MNGISLLNLPYDKCIEILQKTTRQCELIISQIVSIKESLTMDKRNNYVLSPIIVNSAANLSPYRYISSSNNLLTLSQQRKSKSIGNINEGNNILFHITSTPNTSENRARDINNLRELENNIIACDSPIQLHEADEVANVNEEKYLGDVNIGTVMHLKKMGSLKNFEKYQMSPSKSMPDLPKV